MADQDRSLVSRLAYAIRDRLNAYMFAAIETDEKSVLDVGGGSFYLRLRARGFRWERYVILEPVPDGFPEPDEAVECLLGSAEEIPAPDEEFDLVLGIQVLEHVIDPGKALQEMVRVLRPGGRIVLLTPQTGTLHLVPHHFANLTRFWFFAQAERLRLDVVTWRPMGGAWRTLASRLFLMFWPVIDIHRTRDRGLPKRSLGFWITLPLQLIVAAVMFPLALLLSFFDIEEEANNNLFVLQKPGK